MSSRTSRRGTGRRVPAPSGPFRGRLLTGSDWFAQSFDGERVALLATGAEAAGILPEVLRTAAAVTVLEEEPTWVVPVPVPWGPLRAAACRAWLRWSVDDPWTRRQLTPHARFGSRHVTVSPSYYAALQDPRTRLVHWPAYALVPEGVRTADGVEHRVDTVVVGATSRFAGRVDPPHRTGASVREVVA